MMTNDTPQERILQAATLNWVRDENDNQWIVSTPDGEPLGYLPAKLSDREAMKILHLMRDFETGGFNSGKEVGMHAMRKAVEGQIQNLEAQITVLSGMNEKLAAQLEAHIERE